MTLSDDDGVRIRRVLQASGLPEPSVRAQVRGRGRARTLSWRLRRIPGQRVKFVESARDVRRVIGTATAARGSLRFRPAVGRGGRRQILALVEQDGRPRVTLTLGSYVASSPPRPTRPRSLRVVRRGAALSIQWRPGTRGFRHAVYVALSDGQGLLRIAGPQARSVRIAGVQRSVGARVTVTGLTRVNRKGPAARTSIRPRRRTSRRAGG